jgi:hypothetical protein
MLLQNRLNFFKIRANKDKEINTLGHLFDRPVLTRMMLQEAFELLMSRVCEPPTDQTVIRIAR